jgi:hypothetical protein
MEVNFINRLVVNLGFGRAQRFENPDGFLPGNITDASVADDPANLTQAAMRMMAMMVLMMVVLMVRVAVVVVVLMFVRLLAPFRPEFFPGQVLLAGGDYVYFGGTDAAAQHPGDLQPGIYAERFHCLPEQFERNSGIHQRAKKHIAADAGKTLQISDSHQI